MEPRFLVRGQRFRKKNNENSNKYCGAKEFGNPPFHVKPKAHAKEEEIPKDEQKRSKLSGDVAEDNPVLGKLRSQKEKAAHHHGKSPRASQGKAPVQ